MPLFNVSVTGYNNGFFSCGHGHQWNATFCKDASAFNSLTRAVHYDAKQENPNFRIMYFNLVVTSILIKNIEQEIV